MSATGSGFGTGFCAVTGAGGGAGCCRLGGVGFGPAAAGLRAGAWVCAGGKNVAGRLAVWQAVLAKRPAVSGAIRKESFVILIFSITYATSSSPEKFGRATKSYSGQIRWVNPESGWLELLWEQARHITPDIQLTATALFGIMPLTNPRLCLLCFLAGC